MDFKNAIFDMDGTLIDSMQIWRNVEADSVEDIYSVKFTEQERNNLKYLTYHDFIAKSAELKVIDINISDVTEESYRRMAEVYMSGKIIIKPFVLEYLSFLKSKGVGIALATATRRNVCIPYLKQSGIFPYLDYIFTEDDAQSTKSESSKVYDLALEALQGTQEDTVIFEDVLGCIKTAKNNGYRVIAVFDKCQGDTVNEIINISDKYINTYKELME